jgi:hypothetical protein
LYLAFALLYSTLIRVTLRFSFFFSDLAFSIVLPSFLRLVDTTKLAFTITVLILPGYTLAYLFRYIVLASSANATSYKSDFTLKLAFSKLTGTTKTGSASGPGTGTGGSGGGSHQ